MEALRKKSVLIQGLSFYPAFVELANREYQIPVFAPDKVSGFYFELFEKLNVLVLIVSGVWMFNKETTKINCLCCFVVKPYCDFVTINIRCFFDLYCFHICRDAPFLQRGVC